MNLVKNSNLDEHFPPRLHKDAQFTYECPEVILFDIALKSNFYLQTWLVDKTTSIDLY